ERCQECDRERASGRRRSPRSRSRGAVHRPQYRRSVHRRTPRNQAARETAWCSLFAEPTPMDLLLARLAFGVLLPIIVLVIILLAWAVLRRRRAEVGSGRRLAALEGQVRGLLYRVWTLEQAARSGSAAVPEVSPEVPAPPPAAAPAPLVPPAEVRPEPLAPPVEVALLPSAPLPGAPSPVAAEAPPPPRALDLEQRIGARWTTWVGVVAILFGVAFFLKWSFENNLLGPGARVGLGLIAGCALLAAGWLLRDRSDVPYLSEGLAGLGLGVLYLSIYGARGIYGL